MSGRLIVFLGPSLPLREARRLVRAEFRPPARRGDVFRALAEGPRALALIDGVFEAEASVWHHELLAALHAGVTVFGASSMGALRAAELAQAGMIGVGAIARGYRQGTLRDDADVALLHGDASTGHRAYTVPLVNVHATLAAAARARALTPRELGALRRLAAATHYQDRTWSQLASAVPAQRRAAVLAWLRAHAVDQKAADARECLRVAGELLARRVPPAPARAFYASSLVRRLRLMETSRAWLERLSARKDLQELEAQGTRRLLLAALARGVGLEPSPADLAAARRRLPGQGLAADEREAMAQALALEALVLSAPERFVQDGPSRLEGLAFEGRLRGLRGR